MRKAKKISAPEKEGGMCGDPAVLCRMREIGLARSGDGRYTKKDMWNAAAGMAISQGWSALVGPVMLVGTFGYVIGTYLGILVGGALGA